MECVLTFNNKFEQIFRRWWNTFSNVSISQPQFSWLNTSNRKCLFFLPYVKFWRLWNSAILNIIAQWKFNYFFKTPNMQTKYSEVTWTAHDFAAQLKFLTKKQWNLLAPLKFHFSLKNQSVYNSWNCRKSIVQRRYTRNYFRSRSHQKRNAWVIRWLEISK